MAHLWPNPLTRRRVLSFISVDARMSTRSTARLVTDAIPPPGPRGQRTPVIPCFLGDLGTYATVTGWWLINPNWLWAVCIVLPWLYSLRRLLRALVLRSQPTATPPLVIQALRMLWFGCGIFLSIFSVAVIVAGDMHRGWFNAVVAGIFGIAFFVSSYLCNLAWMRWVAAGWWGAALLLYALRHRLEVLPLSAVLILVLLALPGLLLWRRRPAGA